MEGGGGGDGGFCLLIARADDYRGEPVLGEVSLPPHEDRNQIVDLFCPVCVQKWYRERT